jgi:diguanylate cyclase (GGDEF)-like protein
VLQFLSKPLVASWTGGPGDSPQTYIATTYALYSQSLGAVLQVAMGLLVLTLLVRDMLVEITARSETDPLSGLYNRRGFEQRVDTGLAAARKAGLPVALVACDLDHFKAINDNYGHDMGDRVIESFAAILKGMAGERTVVARVGGEEFAVFLSGSNAAGARLFAEAVRTAFAASPPPGLPEWKRCTASFGVAEWHPEDSLSDLRRRADAALYAAKRGGRDRVHVAEPALDAMPQHPYPKVAG